MKQTTSTIELKVTPLTEEEIKIASGGIAPIIGLGVAAVGHFTARTMLTALAGRIGLGLAVYDVAATYGPDAYTSNTDRTESTNAR